MKYRIPLLALAAFIPFTPLPSFALGFRIADQDPAATARGDAFAATADDPSAIYYNPAGITQLTGENLSFGTYGIYLKDHVQPKGGGIPYDSTNTFQVAPELYYTYTPPKFPISFGLGVYSPYGFGLQYPDNTPFRTLATQGQLVYITANPVVAWKVCSQLSLAVGMTINYGDATLARGIYSPGDQFRFRGQGTGEGFNAGVLWEPCKFASVGLNYRSATQIKFDGYSDVKVAPYAAYGNDTIVTYPREVARVGIPFPQNAVFGISLRPAKDWNFEFDLDWTDWNVLKTVELSKASGNVFLPFHWNSSFFYEAGLTHNFDYGLRGSVGYIYSGNSVPAADFNPIVPDSNRHIFSVGIGQDINRFTWDLAYQLAYGPDRTISNGGVADGTYSFLSHAVSLSFGIRF